MYFSLGQGGHEAKAQLLLIRQKWTQIEMLAGQLTGKLVLSLKKIIGEGWLFFPYSSPGGELQPCGSLPATAEHL